MFMVTLHGHTSSLMMLLLAKGRGSSFAHWPSRSRQDIDCKYAYSLIFLMLRHDWWSIHLETIAEETHRPLYAISSGELGTDVVQTDNILLHSSQNLEFHPTFGRSRSFFWPSVIPQTWKERLLCQVCKPSPLSLHFLLMKSSFPALNRILPRHFIPHYKPNRWVWSSFP